MASPFALNDCCKEENVNISLIYAKQLKNEYLMLENVVISMLKDLKRHCVSARMFSLLTFELLHLNEYSDKKITDFTICLKYFQIYVTGQSYQNELCIKGLTPFMNIKNVCYELDLGYRMLNALETKTFTLVNTSTVQAYKFDITSPDYLIFLPSSGHLKESSTKMS